MKYALIAAGLAIGLAACETDGVDRDAETGMAADTFVTERTVQDTSVVTYDTTVDVDTNDAGEGVVGRDTMNPGMQTGGRMMPQTDTQASPQTR